MKSGHLGEKMGEVYYIMLVMSSLSLPSRGSRLSFIREWFRSESWVKDSLPAFFVQVEWYPGWLRICLVLTTHDPVVITTRPYSQALRVSWLLFWSSMTTFFFSFFNLGAPWCLWFSHSIILTDRREPNALTSLTVKSPLKGVALCRLFKAVHIAIPHALPVIWVGGVPSRHLSRLLGWAPGIFVRMWTPKFHVRAPVLNMFSPLQPISLIWCQYPQNYFPCFHTSW